MFAHELIVDTRFTPLISVFAELDKRQLRTYTVSNMSDGSKMAGGSKTSIPIDLTPAYVQKTNS